MNTQEFLLSMRRLDNMALTPRDIILLWAIDRQPGMMGKEMSDKLGYSSRSIVQNRIRILLQRGLIEDRRPDHSIRQAHATPNKLHITEAGQKCLSEIVPQ